MLKEFNEIIGYDYVKEELECTLDIIKDQERYAHLGVSIPRGLLLHGAPGTGKTTIAECFIAASGRPSIVCKKTSPNGEFVKEIKQAFDDAAECAPSILLLDDMDKFANDDDSHRNSEEYVTVQACIDDIKGKDVFVLATTNDLNNLPKSLTRSGRFDRILELNEPNLEDATLIVKHYLKDKAVTDDVDPSVVAAILNEKSCADLESVTNQAGMLAGFKHEESISFKDIIDACLIKFNNVPLDRLTLAERKSEDLWNASSNTYWHEAGHAAMQEILSPGSVVLVYANTDKEKQGFVQPCLEGPPCWNFSKAIVSIMVCLSGITAVEIMFGIKDEGAFSDIRKAMHFINELNENYSYSGFTYAAPRMDETEQQLFMRSIANDVLLEYFYSKAKNILVENKDFLEAIARSLYEKSVLTQLDMKKIREECKIKQPTFI